MFFGLIKKKPKLSKEEKKKLDDLEKANYIEMRTRQIKEEYK